MIDDSDLPRLQKVLALAGIGSRRACEILIAQGRVEVNGAVVEEQGMRVDPLTAIVRVDGQRVPTIPDMVVIAFNKPRGVVSTMSDENGRRCVGDFVADREERLFHVGRLDAETEGLLILTNDGNLGNRLAHPSHDVEKTYIATVSGKPAKDVFTRLRNGVDLDDGPAKAVSARLVQQLPDRAMVEIVLHEGRNRIVRRMMDSVGHPVLELVRTRIGPIYLGQQRPGVMRELHGAELRSLYTDVGL